MLPAEAVVDIRPIGTPVACGHIRCTRVLGWRTPGTFVRANSYDIIEAPANVQLRCSCGYVTRMGLTQPTTVA